MSGAKSILEIDVQDEKFKAYAAEFNKYRDAVAALPGAWGKIGQAAGDAGDSFSTMVDAMRITAAATAATAVSHEKLFNLIEGSANHSERLERTTKNVALHIQNATLSMIKWSGLLGAAGTLAGGLLGVGSIWGLDRLAASAGGARRSAMGLGVSSAEQQAFNVNYSRAVNPDSVLANIADAKSDVNKNWILAGLKIPDFQNRDAADLAPDVLEAGRKLFQRNPTQQGLEAYGLDKIAPIDDWRRVAAMSDDEIAQMRAHNKADVKTFGLDANTLKKWQDLTAQIDRAGAAIENTFIKGLVPLAGPIEKLSDGFSDLAASFLKAPQVKEGIEDLASGLETVANWFKTGHFPWNDTNQTPIDPKEEAAHPTALGRWMYEHFDRLRGGTAGTGQDPDMNAWLRQGDHDAGKTASWAQWASGVHAGDRAQFAKDYFRRQGYSEEGATAITAMLSADSKLDPSAFNPAGGGEGAQGIAGWRGSRIHDFEKLFGHPLKGAPFQEQLDFAAWELEHGEKASGAIARRTNYGPRGARELVKSFLRPGADEGAESLRAEWLAYGYQGLQPTADRPAAPGKPGKPGKPGAPAKVTIVVQNNTGGSAIVAGSQAAAGY